MRDLDQAVELIKAFEGFSATPYQDSGGVWTQGYGTTEGVLHNSRPIGEAEATLMLEYDLRKTVKAIERLVKYPLNDNQFAALCSFVYNVGIHAFETSTMLRVLNHGNYELCAGQFERWNKVKGKVVKGLTNRRLAEKSLFMKDVPDA